MSTGYHDLGNGNSVTTVLLNGLEQTVVIARFNLKGLGKAHTIGRFIGIRFNTRNYVVYEESGDIVIVFPIMVTDMNALIDLLKEVVAEAIKETLADLAKKSDLLQVLADLNK